MLHFLDAGTSISGKPKVATEKTVEGRLRKCFAEVVFMEQKYVVDDSKSLMVSKIGHMPFKVPILSWSI